MTEYTKESLIEKLQEIKKMGWIKSVRSGNVGGIGNTLESLLGITENNLPIPNASEWELKCQRINTSSLTTLFHMEPSPRAMNIVPNILLKKYGWSHNLAGSQYPKGEMSFRQTISCLNRSDRGFMIKIDKKEQKVLVTFDSNTVDERHKEWLKSVKQRIGLQELDPQPYWGFKDLFHKAGTKLLNCFYVQADSKSEDKVEYFNYEKALMLQEFDLDKFLTALEKGDILVDFDARTGHNHGTKFRLRQNALPNLYKISKDVLK